MRHLASVLLPLLLPLTAIATDGVVEINQSCAVQTGCFTGDSPGFPVAITGAAGRSYRLTSDLVVGDPDTDGLLLGTSRLTVDFNGFTLVGPGLGSGSGRGVTGSGTDGSFAGMARLHNGTIRGMLGKGIALGGALGVVVEDMAVRFNSGGGVFAGEDARILRNRILSNGSIDDGVFVGPGSVVSGNTISESGRYGIFAGAGSLVSDNVVRESRSTGILAPGGGSSVDRNVASGNGTSGSGSGIVIGSASSGRRDNTAWNNTDSDIAGGADAGGNVCSGCP